MRKEKLLREPFRRHNHKNWAEGIPRRLTVAPEGLTVYMVHNEKEVPADLSGVDLGA